MGYLTRFFTAFCAVLAAVAALNALADPFDILGTPIIDGMNQVKTPAPDRFFKPLQVAARQPHTVLIGDSRVMLGLDPHDVPGGEAYNLGIPAATLSEEMALARHVLADTPATQIVIGFDYLSFGDRIDEYPSFRLAILGRFALWRGLPDLLVSQRALERTWFTLLYSRRHASPSYQHDGLRLTPARSPSEAISVDDSLRLSPAERILQSVTEYTLDYREMRDPGAALDRLGPFLASLPPSLAVSAFITPGHAALLEPLAALGHRPAYDSWLVRLTAICAARRIPLWDFGGYNPITTQPIATAGPSYFDGSHFRPPIGRMVLATMLGGADTPDFGVRLTPETISGYLARQETARAAWHREQPEDLRAIAAAIRAAAR